jgi:hypothetical protein
MATPVSALLRLLLVAGAAVTLAGCFETAGLSGPTGLTAGLEGQSAAARQAMPAGRATRAPTMAEPTATPEYLTLEKAKGDCWLQAETDKKAPKNLDQRNKWVEKCAAGKMREQATQWASPTAQAASASAPPPPPSGSSFSLPGLSQLQGLLSGGGGGGPSPPAAAEPTDSMQKGM